MHILINYYARDKQETQGGGRGATSFRGTQMPPLILYGHVMENYQKTGSNKQASKWTGGWGGFNMPFIVGLLLFIEFGGTRHFSNIFFLSPKDEIYS